MLRPICLALLLPAAALADESADLAAMETFRARPCLEVLEVIHIQEASGTDLGNLLGIVGKRSLFLGMLAGYDMAHGGLQGDAESTLVRLGQACEAEPGATVIELLERFAAGKAD